MWWETRRASALFPLEALGWRGAAHHIAGPSLHLGQAGWDSFDFQVHLRNQQIRGTNELQLVISYNIFLKKENKKFMNNFFWAKLLAVLCVLDTHMKEQDRYSIFIIRNWGILWQSFLNAGTSKN